jgi:hypothetical protein
MSLSGGPGAGATFEFKGDYGGGWRACPGLRVGQVNEVVNI